MSSPCESILPTSGSSSDYYATAEIADCIPTLPIEKPPNTIGYIEKKIKTTFLLHIKHITCEKRAGFTNEYLIVKGMPIWALSFELHSLDPPP
jgi:hypothetical protein